MTRMLLLILALGAGLRAEPEIEPEPFTDSDALYAPEDSSATGTAQVRARASYYSQAKITAFDISDPAREVAGAELFLGDKLAGYSPLTLTGFLVSQEFVSLSARAPGYEEVIRPRVNFPAEGEVKVALWGQRGTRWYSWGAGALGLAAIGGSFAAYGQNTSESGTLGAGLLIGGVSLIAVTQVFSRFFHLPALKKKAEAYNQRSEAAP